MANLFFIRLTQMISRYPLLKLAIFSPGGIVGAETKNHFCHWASGNRRKGNKKLKEENAYFCCTDGNSIWNLMESKSLFSWIVWMAGDIRQTCFFPSDFISNGTAAVQWDDVSPVPYCHCAKTEFYYKIKALTVNRSIWSSHTKHCLQFLFLQCLM